VLAYFLGLTSFNHLHFFNNFTVEKSVDYFLDYCFAHILKTEVEALHTGKCKTSDLLELGELIKDSSHFKPKTDKDWAHYLAGLIDGDGHISISDITIVFYVLDLPLAIYLKNLLGSGTIRKIKDKNAYVLRISEVRGITRVLNLINGKIRNPNKLDQILRLLETNKGKKHFSEFVNFRLNTSNNLDNYWLAGFSDADASFQVKIVKRSTRSKAEIRLNFQVDQKTIYLLELIKLYFGGSIGHRKKQDTYYYASVNFANAQKVINYFDKYNLLSSKHLNYLKWRSVWEMIQKQEHITLSGQEKIAQIKGTMNSLSRDSLDLSDNNE
jgi:LAGLIDADG endonuclease